MVKRIYYVKKEGNLYVLRQLRFKKRLEEGKEHPHDIMAYARTKSEMTRMRKSFKLY